MTQTPHASFVRVRHLGKTKGSIFLADLDTQGNRDPHFKRPVYVPFEGSIDIPLVDDVLFSYRTGNIRQFQDMGLVEAIIFSENDVVGTDGDVEISPGNDVVLANTDLGPLTVTLPSLSDVPEGSSVLVIKTSSDDNDLSITTKEGELINQSQNNLSSNKAFVAFAFRSAGEEGGWFLVSEFPTEGGGDGGGGGSDTTYTFHQVSQAVNKEEEGLKITLTEVPEEGSEDVFVNGLRLSSSNYSISSDVVTIGTGVKLYAGDEVVVKFCVKSS